VFSTHCALCFSFLQRDFRIKPAHNRLRGQLVGQPQAFAPGPIYVRMSLQYITAPSKNRR